MARGGLGMSGVSGVSGRQCVLMSYVSGMDEKSRLCGGARWEERTCNDKDAQNFIPRIVIDIYIYIYA